MPAARRRRLIEVAAAEFGSAGYEHASLNRIIDRCGMSKSSFYYVLSSKADLYEFVVRELIADVAADIDVVAPEEFARDEFWPRLERFFASLTQVSQREQKFLLLGRMFYLQAPDPARTAVSGALEAVQDWVQEVLRVGRRCGAVRTDLPQSLQAELIFRLLQVFDEWTIAHYDEFADSFLAELADAQFATIRRTLAP
ncbi:TetR/AcrR family transcriptional regulator [Mycolicibacterium sp. GF69]|uniref:TetR/AcrR family transcriptional regulator n=1 Tax=Mycolicibacterium sp. GF69 TaxID=2267251 RepID=UPI000DCBFD97|nr:TetR/AcrR family transcriptional regulator [Mycolicibacterium sp. GF69]RAV11974.1 TetR/AcrR family transcriptional regulator [Mycolicibacterium sp. GF69]